ncbi:MAG: glycoside hydrolase family 3 protein [Planctomycetota bacterium]|jgi:beta-glucosidase
MTAPLAGGLLVPAIRLPDDYGRVDEFTRLVSDAGVAGFIVYGGDRELTPPFLRHLREVAGGPLLLMADYERGAGQHVSGMPELPPAMALAAARTPEAAYMAGKITALSARSLSVGVVLAPVLDVLSRPGNPIVGTRAFSDDPDHVTRHGLAFIEGVQEEGVFACAKHFPGHGHTGLDSHTHRPRVSAPLRTLEERELPPFRAAARAGVALIMTAHVVYDDLDPDVPATFSRPIVTDLLKDRWGYSGLVVTDALVMEGAKGGDEHPAVRALLAGVDLLLCPDDPWKTIEAVEEAVADGRLSEEALAVTRGRVAMAAADQLFDAPVRKDLTKEYAFEIETMAKRSLTSAMGEGLRTSLAAGVREVVGLVVDEDSEPGRARAFDSRRERFTGGVVHVTPEGTGVAGGLAESLRGADLIVMGIFSDVRAYKGRVGLSPPLKGFATEVLRVHPDKTVVVSYGSPHLVADLPARHVVFAYGGAEAQRRASLDALFEGGGMPGRLPVRLLSEFPMGDTDDDG